MGAKESPRYIPAIGALSHPFFGWEGIPTKLDYRKKGNTFLLPFLLPFLSKLD